MRRAFHFAFIVFSGALNETESFFEEKTMSHVYKLHMYFLYNPMTLRTCTNVTDLNLLIMLL